MEWTVASYEGLFLFHFSQATTENYTRKELRRENFNLMKHQNANNSVARTIYAGAKLHLLRIHVIRDSRWILNLSSLLVFGLLLKTPLSDHLSVFHRAG